MKISKFTENPTVLPLIERAKALKEKENIFSDIVDNSGNQYVDLVQEGGGVLGIALVGYTYVLESAGIRFFSLAGTSAGAINTMMLAGVGRIHEAKSMKILEILSVKDLFDLVDGDQVVKKVIRKILSKEGGIGWTLVWNGIKLYRILKNRLGLNPGTNFKDWITEELSKADIHSLGDLLKLREKLPEGLKNREEGTSAADYKAKLAIITSDITTHSKIEFPKMAELFWAKPEDVAPADLVRASMSIPFFFEPFQISGLPNAGNEEDPTWNKHAKYLGEVPSSVKFVDGGMLSNFPINVFHRKDGGVPSMPTFGVRLSTYRRDYSKNKNILGISGAMISTMRQIHDYDFLLNNPDHSMLICRIDADRKFNWLDFNMKEKDQISLFNLGAEKAIEFLEGFDWKKYKQVRRSLSQGKS